MRARENPSEREEERRVHDIHVGIGSNLGDRQANILAALQRLRRHARDPLGFVVLRIGRGRRRRGTRVPQRRRRPAFRTRCRCVRTIRSSRRAGGRPRPRHAPARARVRSTSTCSFSTDGSSNRSSRRGRTTPRRYSKSRPHLVSPPVDRSVRKRERALALRRRPPSRMSRRSGFRSAAPASPACDGFCISRSTAARTFTTPRSRWSPTSLRTRPASTCRASPKFWKRRRSTCSRPRTLRRASNASPRRSRARSSRSQRAVRADVRLRADFGLERWTPVSGKRGEETYTLLGIAHADETGTRRVVGVEAEGMTACPCAQAMVREHSMRELCEAGFSESDARRALDALPVATHNQRGRGSILLGAQTSRGDSRRRSGRDRGKLDVE